MSKKHNDFYEKPPHVRLATRIIEGLLSMGVVHLLAPYLLQTLAPVQAQINAGAVNAGQAPPTAGTNLIANKLIQAVGT